MPPIVLIHGMSGTPAAWDNFKGLLTARGYDVHVPALRHHHSPAGAVPHPDLGTTSLLDYAADLEKLIATLPQKPVLIGHSMGGLLALMLAARGQARCAVLLAPAAPSGINAITPSVLRVGWRTMLTWGFWRNPVMVRYGEARWGVYNCVDEAEARRLYADMVQDSGRVVFEIGFPQFDRKSASRVDPAKITCPLLVIAGAEDRMTPASVVRRIARRYGGEAAYVELPGHGHWLLGEPGWEKIAQRCAEWSETTLARQPATRT